MEPSVSNMLDKNSTIVRANVGFQFDLPEKRAPLSDYIGLWPCLRGIFLIANRCRRLQPTVGSATLRKAVLGYINKQAEQALRSKPVSSVPL